MRLPTFFKRQILLKAVPGGNIVPSGTVTSLMNRALSWEATDTVSTSLSSLSGSTRITPGISITSRTSSE